MNKKIILGVGVVVGIAVVLLWFADTEQRSVVADHAHDADGNHVAVTGSNDRDMHSHFSHFDSVSTFVDDAGEYFRVSSDGLANHDMMVGITSWQQQVPIPQEYTGANSWSIPLEPELADEPLLLSEHFHKGAVAIAVNGVPIFNAVNNRGEYAGDIGELDQWGGHSGKADDYHYHLVPEHLEEIVGEGNPVAYAFDGFPVYGQTDAELDEYLGRFTSDGSYQYHAVDYQPYFIAGFRGEVQTDSPANAPEDQVVPQARSQPVRTANYGPLQGAEITSMTSTGPNSYLLEYERNGSTSTVAYSWDEDGRYTFVYTDAAGNEVMETY